MAFSLSGLGTARADEKNGRLDIYFIDVEGVADSGKTPIEADKIEKIAMFTCRGVHKFSGSCIG